MVEEVLSCFVIRVNSLLGLSDFLPVLWVDVFESYIGEHFLPSPYFSHIFVAILQKHLYHFRSLELLLWTLSQEAKLLIETVNLVQIEKLVFIRCVKLLASKWFSKNKIEVLSRRRAPLVDQNYEEVVYKGKRRRDVFKEISGCG